MVDEVADSGFSRGAASYRDARPAYHPGIVDEIVQHAGGGPLIELGAGTGVLTGALVTRGVEVIAVEPVEAMREALAADVPDATIREGTAEAIPAAADSADAVVAAQAFHWFDARAALDDIARVLRPGGHLTTVWNVRDESVAWVARYSSIVDRYEGNAPRYKTMEWRRAIEADERFSLHYEVARPNPQRVDRERVVKRALSTSFIAALPDDERDAVADEIRDVVRELDEIFDFPYVSHLQAWRHLS